MNRHPIYKIFDQIRDNHFGLVPTILIKEYVIYKPETNEDLKIKIGH